MPGNNINIPEDFVALLEREKREKQYRPKEVIYAEGDHADRFYYLKKGQVQIFVTSDNGTEKTLTLYKEHTFFGEAAFFDGFPRMSSSRTITSSLVIPISRQNILDWFRSDPNLAFSMIASLSKTIRMLSNQINQISFLSADKRLAHLLLEETRHGHTSITLTQEEIGNMIGVNRVTVSRILREFRQHNWVKTGYGTIRVTDSENLQAFSETLD